MARALMGFFDYVAPAAQLFVSPYRYAGIVLMALAVGLVVWAWLLFRRAGTGVMPFSPATALVIPAFMALIAERFIEGEEALLERTFGTQYLDYKARVRRWL